jgi:hypothetical protein
MADSGNDIDRLIGRSIMEMAVVSEPALGCKLDCCDGLHGRGWGNGWSVVVSVVIGWWCGGGWGDRPTAAGGPPW